MRGFAKLRWYTAGLLAFLVGVPLTEQAMGQGTGDIVTAAINLGLAIAGSAGRS